MESFADQLSHWLQQQYVQRLLIMIAAFMAIVIGLRMIKRTISSRISDTDLSYRIRKTTNIFAYLLFVLVLIFIYNDKLGNIGVVLGLAGAGIAFALQEVITSIAGWISIMVSNQIRIGHRVKIGNLRGDIIDISVLKTTIMEIGDWVDGDLYNGRITTISNNFVFKEPLQNYSADYPFLWDEIKVPIRTESNYKKARQLFTDVVNEVCGEYASNSEKTWQSMKRKYRIEDANVKPMISMAFDENWITFTIRYIVDFRLRRTTKDKLFTRLLDVINENHDDVDIAVASSEVVSIKGSEDGSPNL